MSVPPAVPGSAIEMQPSSGESTSGLAVRPSRTSVRKHGNVGSAITRPTLVDPSAWRFSQEPISRSGSEAFERLDDGPSRRVSPLGVVDLISRLPHHEHPWHDRA